MFTGIIEAVGRVKNIEAVGGDMRLHVDTGGLDMSDVQLGDSIAVNGVCLTAITFDAHSFAADVSNETISLTSLNSLKAGSEVNLEKALLPTTRLGGHLVSGHVDGLAEVLSIKDESRSIRLLLRAPDRLKRYIATKGSVSIDGTSLTVNRVDDAEFEINIVPHTQQRTIIRHYRPGTKVNLEVDVIARYLERLLTGGSEHADGQNDNRAGISVESLARAGFVKP